MRAKVVMLVEPDQRECQAAKAALETLGYEVVAMGDVDAAVAVFPYVEANVVLTAHPLRTATGQDFATHAKRTSPKTLVIGLVERSRADAARHALTSGCDDFISKPLAPEILANKVRLLIGASSDFWPPLEH